MLTMDGSKEETGAAVDDVDVLMMFNADSSPRVFCVPQTPHPGKWRLMIDTGLPPPHDFYAEDKAPQIEEDALYKVRPRSMVMMFSSWQRS